MSKFDSIKTDRLFIRTLEIKDKDVFFRYRNNIIKRAGIAPSVFVDMYIANFLHTDAKIDMKAVEAHQLTESDKDKLTAKAVEEIKKHFHLERRILL